MKSGNQREISLLEVSRTLKNTLKVPEIGFNFSIVTLRCIIECLIK